MFCQSSNTNIDDNQRAIFTNLLRHPAIHYCLHPDIPICLLILQSMQQRLLWQESAKSVGKLGSFRKVRNFTKEMQKNNNKHFLNLASSKINKTSEKNGNGYM